MQILLVESAMTARKTWIHRPSGIVTVAAIAKYVGTRFPENQHAAS